MMNVPCLTLAAVLAWQQSSMNDGLRLAAAGDFAGAERILSQIVAADAKNAELRYRYGLVLLRQKKMAEAGTQLEAAAALAPSNAVVWLAVAQVRLHRGELDRSADAGRKAADLAPGEATVSHLLSVLYAQLGKAYHAAKNPAKAVEAWQESIRLDPSQPASYTDLAQLFLDHRTPEPAVLVLANAAKRFPENAALLRLYGLAQYATGDTRAAMATFLRVIDLAPDTEEHYTSLETLLPEAGERLEEIKLRLRQLVTRRPSSAIGAYLLALIEPSESEMRLRAAIQAEPNFWPAHYELYKALAARGENREAAETLRRAVALNPDYAPAHFALAQVYAKLGDRERAAEQRRLHHDLLLKERKAAETRQTEMQRLPYRLSPQ